MYKMENKWKQLKAENKENKKAIMTEVAQVLTQQQKDADKEHKDRLNNINVVGEKIVQSKTLKIIETVVTALLWVSKIIKVFK